MDKLVAIVLLLGSLMLIKNRSGSSNAETRMPNESEPRKEKLTKLRVYLQDVGGGPNRTVWEVAQSPLTDILPSQFGLVVVTDNLVTSGPEPDSGKVGRMQGIAGFSDLQERALVLLFNLVFTEGEYKGSTLSILGRNPLGESEREVSIVGGTGAFRMARGYAITRTHSTDEAQSYGIFEYNFVVYHFEGVGFADA